MAAKLTRLTHKIAIQIHLVAEGCTICSSRTRRQSGNFSIYSRKGDHTLEGHINTSAWYSGCVIKLTVVLLKILSALKCQLVKKQQQLTFLLPYLIPWDNLLREWFIKFSNDYMRDLYVQNIKRQVLKIRFCDSLRRVLAYIWITCIIKPASDYQPDRTVAGLGELSRRLSRFKDRDPDPENCAQWRGIISILRYYNTIHFCLDPYV
jgi:hypothetical protein